MYYILNDFLKYARYLFAKSHPINYHSETQKLIYIHRMGVFTC